jgi:hypothetical protein
LDSNALDAELDGLDFDDGFDLEDDDVDLR